MGVAYVARYALRRIEEVFHPTAEFKVPNEVHIEHIMPKAITDAWSHSVEPDEEYEDIVERWGNLTLLHSRPNQTIGNGPFEQKKKYFKDSQVMLTRLLADANTWTSTEIDQRQRWLAQVAEYVWSPRSLNREPFAPPKYPAESVQQG